MMSSALHTGEVEAMPDQATLDDLDLMPPPQRAEWAYHHGLHLDPEVQPPVVLPPGPLYVPPDWHL